MHKVDTQGLVTLVPVGFVPIVTEYADPEYTGGLYPLGNIIDLTAYIDFVEGQGGLLRDVNATCAVEGVTEVILSSNEVTIVYTNRQTGEVYTETQTVTQDDNRLSFSPLHLDTGNYAFEVLLDGVLIYRGAYCTENSLEEGVESTTIIETITGDATCEPIQADHTVEKIARTGSVSFVEGNETCDSLSREQEKDTISRDTDKEAISRPVEKTTVSRNGLYNYTSR
jgi:hypothetical protein